ncbi:LysR family transcriptional regulator [Conexibacter sp. W3-3-2]|uniref:LysR family transcriptional regulator n=1 Tax=Conexibacter sp. W3-3-2 TaxID=2675227 RepID=UPI0012B6ACEB|nr:LysR family transcriptional regulator [Conexibacter sp. W3-3-2]MTD45517.1 LysR family transcriptional regulator [Conexibacter sp. W3-3-2]
MSVTYDLRLLTSFLAVADELHFGRAAERLQVAQPALSQQLRRLETQLGVQLFDRDARKVELTGAGKAFLPGAREAVAAAHRAALAAQRVTDTAPAVLRVAVDLDLPERVLQQIRLFSQIRSEIELKVVRQHQGDALDALHGDQVDLVVGWGRMPYGPPLRSLTLDSEEILAVLRDDHPEAVRPAMTRDAFGRGQFVMFEREQSADVFDWLAVAAAGRQPEQLRIQQVRSLDDGASAMLRSAGRGCGQTIVAASRFDAAAHPRLRTIPFDPPLRHEIVAMWTAESESAAVLALADSWGRA